jgi:hypothetical protein
LIFRKNFASVERKLGGGEDEERPPMLKQEPEPIELQISGEKLFYIIVKAREFDAKVPPVEPHSGSNASDDGEGEILEDFSDDPTAEELKAAIDQLSDDEIIDLIAITWVGRGDFDRAGFAEARATATERHRGRSAKYLMGIPNLGDCLEEGLAELGHSVGEFGLGRL